MNVWEITREGYATEIDKIADDGNRFFIGNGAIGVRGALEEFGKAEQAAVNLAGVYDKAPGRTWREPVNAPNGFYARLDGAGGIKAHKQSLNFRYGLYRRETIYENAVFTAERFVSMANPDLMCRRLTVEPTGGEVTLTAGIDADVWDLNGPHLIDVRCEGVREGGGVTLKVSAVTYEKAIPIRVTETCNAQADDITVGAGIFRVFKIREKTVIDSVITVNAEHVAVDYDGAFAEHRAVWDGLWKNSAITLIGDEAAQQALNYSLYHLHSIAPRHADNLSVPARGLSGQTYKGAVFWDTEIFLMPFFTLTEPQLAKKLIKYRIDTLDGALRKAAEYGFKGAFFPWESQDGGVEGCTDFNIVDVFTGRPVRTFFRDKQIHITGDVAYALGKYVEMTGDTSIMEQGGERLLKECAEFYLSRAYSRYGSELLEFTDVVGPDEYHERVDNNAFTNKMAEYTLKTACYPQRVRPFRAEGGIIEQFDGYFKHEDASLAEVKSRIKRPREYWGTQNGVAFATQIIKQADVIAMMNLFPNEFTDEEVEANWRYYEPRTEHGSSLSACMYALSACRFGRADLAYPLFEKSVRADLDGGGKCWAGDIYIGGTHPAAAGGAYMIASQGFAGLRIEDGKPSFKPCLPEQIDGVETTFTLRGERYAAAVTRGDTRDYDISLTKI